MTTATNVPDSSTPVPTGADDASEWWEDGRTSYRIVYSYRHKIGGEDVTMRASAIQFADGRVDTGQYIRSWRP